MKALPKLKFKDFLWDRIKKFTNNLSKLSVKNLGNGDIKCSWEISNLDHLKLEFSKSYFYAIRFFDISNNRNKDKATCIMKEIQVSKFQSSISFPIPVNKGVYYFEFGYRKRNGEWRLLASNALNLGYRIKKIIRRFDNDNWFILKPKISNIIFSPHDQAYQLSFNDKIGGSENLFNL